MTEITQADRDAAEEHFNVWYPDTAWGYDALVDTLARHREQAIETLQEQHEAYKQEVSDVLLEYYGGYDNASGETLERFIIPKPTVDPLVEVLAECDDGSWDTKFEYAAKMREALAQRGFKIVEDV